MVHIGHRIEAAGVNTRDFTGSVANVLRGDHVGRAEDIGQTNKDEMFQALRHANPETDGSRAVLFLYLI
ncbi:MAG: hypothetical protein CSYNP_04469 [Syntrophus sp. SKADARSKE-3]|nr:hypothetical protein [Syntrophus sp. SKADARSKE-3]